MLVIFMVHNKTISRRDLLKYFWGVASIGGIVAKSTDGFAQQKSNASKAFLEVLVANLTTNKVAFEDSVYKVETPVGADGISYKATYSLPIKGKQEKLVVEVRKEGPRTTIFENEGLNDFPTSLTEHGYSSSGKEIEMKVDIQTIQTAKNAYRKIYEGALQKLTDHLNISPQAKPQK